MTTPVSESLARAPFPRAPFNQSMKNVGQGLLLSSAFAVAGGVVMGTGKLLSTARRNQKEGNGLTPDWPQTIEAAVTSARASWTAGGFAAFLFPNALRYGVGREIAEKVVETGAHEIARDSRLAKMLLGTSLGGYAANSLGRAAILGSVVAIAGGLAVFAQRTTDTAMTKWQQGEGFAPDWEKSAKSGVTVATIGLLAGGAASFLLKRPLGITL